MTSALAVRQHQSSVDVRGPWSLATCRAFWEGFTPAAHPAHDDPQQLHTVFLCEADWRRVTATVTQHGRTAVIQVAGDGDLEAAAAQVSRFLALDVDARAWPDVAAQDPVITHAQDQLPGLRPCGFHSPYEAAAWAVLSQRLRIPQAARLRQDLIARHGDDGAFPTPHVLLQADLDLPGRKNDYLHAVAAAADEGRLDTATLRRLGPDHAMTTVQDIKGLGPFGAELVVLRGANTTDTLPRHEHRLTTVIDQTYGADQALAELSLRWRPFRTWAAFHLRVLGERPADG